MSSTTSSTAINWPVNHILTAGTTCTVTSWYAGEWSAYQSSLNSIDFRKVLVSKWESHPEVILEEEPYDYGPNSF